MDEQTTHNRAAPRGSQQSSSADSESSSKAAPAAQHAAEQLREAATSRVESARRSAEDAKARAAQRVRKLSGAVRKIGEHMRVEDQTYIADRATAACERLDAVATYIDDAELRSLLHDAEDLARRRPAYVFGGTFLIGFAAARLIRGSSEAAQSQQTLTTLPEQPASRPLIQATATPGIPASVPESSLIGSDRGLANKPKPAQRTTERGIGR